MANRALGLLACSGRDDGLDPSVDPRSQLVPVGAEADEYRRYPRARRPQAVAAARRIDAGALQADQPGDPLAVVRVDPAARAGSS